MADPCQAKGRIQELMSYYARGGSNITTRERKTRTKLFKEAPREISVSQKPSFMEEIRLVQ